MASILDVAKYILKSYGAMTTMKLQKLVYYCQAWHLVWEDKPLFNARIEAWANGPVCPDLFDAHRGLYQVSANQMKGNIKNLSAKDITTIDAVYRYYGHREAHWLALLSHQEDPWKEARKDCVEGEACNNEITKESMQRYYEGLIK